MPKKIIDVPAEVILDYPGKRVRIWASYFDDMVDRGIWLWHYVEDVQASSSEAKDVWDLPSVFRLADVTFDLSSRLSLKDISNMLEGGRDAWPKDLVFAVMRHILKAAVDAGEIEPNMPEAPGNYEDQEHRLPVVNSLPDTPRRE